MNNTARENRGNSRKSSFWKGPILICAAVCFSFWSLSGAATLSASGSAPEPAAAGLPPESATTSERTFARGIDISRSAGEPSVPEFESIKQQGYRFVIVSGWGGVNPNCHAQVQLSRARSAGLLTAGYCYLNFASAWDGGRQVREALAAFGDGAAFLGFLAIDVETSARNQLSPGLRLETPDASAQQQALTRIAEAVEEVKRVGLRPVIYTKKSDWLRVTGDTQQFKSIPLWHPRTIGGDALHQPDLARRGDTFGGWTSRVGKQFELDTILNCPPIKVDLDVFDLGAFAPSNPDYVSLPPSPDVATLVVEK